eukprot:g3887.t1
MPAAASVILDWGTSSLRAALVSVEGETLETRESASGGIQFVQDRAFEAALMEAIGTWFDQHGPLPVIASGMITSRNGWIEVPYVDAPAGLAELAAGTKQITLQNGARITFLAGMRDPAALPFPDVMRGEETQIVGFGLDKDQTVVLPGTHSKWARVEGGRITGFQTYATGEIFALLTKHSFIAKATEPASGSEPVWWAFDMGAEFAASDARAADAFLSAVFSARTGVLAGTLGPSDIGDYVSGLVIGSEFRQARAAGWLKPGEAIGIVGNNVLNSRYGRVAPLFDLSVEAGEVLLEAGWRIIEVPLNSPEPLKSIEKLQKRFGDRALIGAGTVLTPTQVADVAATGARVVISPNCNPSVISASAEKGLISLPGVATPTEAFAAIEAGATGSASVVAEQSQRTASAEPGILSLVPSDVETDHVLASGSASLAYTATAGAIDLYGQNGRRTAKIFYTAYVAKDRESARPVSFAFNGGPGAASAYLHLGLLGPKIVSFGPTGDDGRVPELAENAASWLPFTDLVFIDPVGTGWSRAESDELAGSFYGVQQDAESLAKFIALYVQRNDRLASPKYLVGESYGGFRAAKVAMAMKANQGLLPSGMVLVSPLLEGRFLSNSDDPLAASLQLPSLAAAEMERRGTFDVDKLADAVEAAL